MADQKLLGYLESFTGDKLALKDEARDVIGGTQAAPSENYSDGLNHLLALYQAAEKLVDHVHEERWAVARGVHDEQEPNSERKRLLAIMSDILPMGKVSVSKADLRIQLKALGELEGFVRDGLKRSGDGAKSAEKMQIAKALPSAFTKDVDTHLDAISTQFAAWSEQLGGALEKHKAEFDAKTTAQLEAARDITKFAATYAKSVVEIDFGMGAARGAA